MAGERHGSVSRSLLISLIFRNKPGCLPLQCCCAEHDPLCNGLPIRPSDDHGLDRLIPCWLPGPGGAAVAACRDCSVVSRPLSESFNGGSVSNGPTDCDAVHRNTCRAITHLRHLIACFRIARRVFRVTLLTQVTAVATTLYRTQHPKSRLAPPTLASLRDPPASA